MSATIGINDLKFVIFASGHDYTLADSGDGDVQIFSHPFVPLNSVNYAGQYYFLVPDENGDPLDCVKDDIAHCTFTPALGSTFDTEGEITVEVNYHREYIYDEETLVVDKTVSQVITVVNHGTVSSSNTYCDLYSDGYCFYRPSSVNTVNNNMWLVGTGMPSKLSCIPWRVQKLGNGIYGFCNAYNLTDISELQYADTSHVIEMANLFSGGRYLTSEKLTEAIGGWNTASLEKIYYFSTSCGATGLSFFEKWNTPNLTNLERAFDSMIHVTSLHGLEHFNVSNVTNLNYTFATLTACTDISAIAGWNVEKVTTMISAFASMPFASLDALGSWVVTALKNITSIFEGCSNVASLEPIGSWSPVLTAMNSAFKGMSSIKNLKGLEHLDVSAVTSLSHCFDGDTAIKSLTGVEGWNVGNVSNFEYAFNDLHFITNILPLKNWDMHSATNVSNMFGSNGFLADVDGIAWNMPNLVSNANAFIGHKLWYSSIIDKVVYEAWWYYYDIDGNGYMGTGIYDEEHPLVQIWKDASDAQNWTVGGSGLGMFNTAEWNNLPSWN